MDISQNYKRLKQQNHLTVQKKLVNKTKNGEKVPSFEAVQVVLVKCNLVNNEYQQTNEEVQFF